MAVGLALSACGGGSPPVSGGLPFAGRHGSGSSPISHVVIIVQENRSFDNLFATFPGAHGATRGMAKEPKKGGGYVDKWIALKPHSLTLGTDLGHCYTSYVTDDDGGKMDGFYDEQKGACSAHGIPSKSIPYEYVEPSQIGPYWDIADQWVLADNMFQTQGSGSFVAHQDLIRGGTCIAGGCSSPTSGTATLVDNPTY